MKFTVALVGTVKASPILRLRFIFISMPLMIMTVESPKMLSELFTELYFTIYFLKFTGCDFFIFNRIKKEKVFNITPFTFVCYAITPTFENRYP